MLRNKQTVASYQGFTLIECLISLVVLMGLLIFLHPFLSMIQGVDNHIKKDNYMELLIGKIQMESEIKEAKFQKIEDNKLYYKKENKENKETIIFENYQQMIRKTSSQNGHQPIVMGIKQVIFSEEKELVKMEVTTLEGETYTYFLFN